ncbi:metallophosphoesterase domain-containing protein 1 isoform X1 [Nannospalax galili]|uniref:metallophosphoesterase domain-containing protein 1 isoform X1 n=1 Tax=Nannospalax galili TaxID=1026970 RepID=UPI0004ED3109|nr:metallophosphoesterase domain-containing protein 1 isoform X1 [Nannospalax galili]XP_008842951.1 metallophosphoesterase domain-containing protein 1 isoform X1 [Nannospalax galili]
MWHSRWDAGVLKAEALALLPCGLGMAFSQSHVMAARRHQHGRLIIEVDEYSSNPTQAFTFYNINQGRFQPPHVQMVDPVPHDAPKPPGYTRFVCVSDTHSRTDPIQMPYGDVLIHAGDFTELGLPSEVKKFNEWLGSLPYEYKIVIAGNHELTFDQEFMADLIKQDFYYFPSVSKLKPENYENVQSLLTNCIYLQDSEVTVRGFRIYGSPWQPWFYGWGFNLPRGQALLEKWNLIPEGVDVLITHGPPLGFLDWVPKKMQRVGCVELLNTVQRRVQPRLHVFGHIHEVGSDLRCSFPFGVIVFAEQEPRTPEGLSLHHTTGYWEVAQRQWAELQLLHLGLPPFFLGIGLGEPVPQRAEPAGPGPWGGRVRGFPCLKYYLFVVDYFHTHFDSR